MKTFKNLLSILALVILYNSSLAQTKSIGYHKSTNSEINQILALRDVSQFGIATEIREWKSLKWQYFIANTNNASGMPATYPTIINLSSPVPNEIANNSSVIIYGLRPESKEKSKRLGLKLIPVFVIGGGATIALQRYAVVQTVEYLADGLSNILGESLKGLGSFMGYD